MNPKVRFFDLKIWLSLTVILVSTAFIQVSSASAQGFLLDFKKPLFSVCAYRNECMISGIRISAFRTAGGEELIENATLRPAILHWDNIDGLGVIGGKEDDEIDPDEKILMELPAPRAIKVFNLSDLFLGSNGRDSAGGEWATISTFNNTGALLNRYDLQGGVELPDKEFNLWGGLPPGRVPGRGYEEVDLPMVKVVLDLDMARAGLRAAGLTDNQAVVTTYQTILRPIKRPENGEQDHALEASQDFLVSRIEFLARQRENNDYSIESIEFWRSADFQRN